MSHATTVSDSNATAMGEFHAAIFDDHDLDAIETYLSPDVVCYQAGMEVASGYDGAREYFGGILEAFPDIELDTVELVADDERVMLRFEATATHEGPLPIREEDGEMMDSLEATGTTVTWQGFVSARFDEGKIVEANQVSDRFGMARQLGLIPSTN